MPVSRKAVESQILNKIGESVSFTYPGDETGKEGHLEDRAVMFSPGSAVPYWDVVDLIHFQGKPKAWIRIAYYRKKDRLVWGGQYSITELVGIWKKLLVQAAKKKPWFKKLLEEVMAEVQEKSANQPAQSGKSNSRRKRT